MTNSGQLPNKAESQVWPVAQAPLETGCGNEADLESCVWSKEPLGVFCSLAPGLQGGLEMLQSDSRHVNMVRNGTDELWVPVSFT